MPVENHEKTDQLSAPTRDLHRTISSLKEELEAIDWYQQRVDATEDEELRAILVHNRDEEIEHACMLIEWLRRRVPKFNEELDAYYKTAGSIIAREEKNASV